MKISKRTDLLKGQSRMVHYPSLNERSEALRPDDFFTWAGKFRYKGRFHMILDKFFGKTKKAENKDTSHLGKTAGVVCNIVMEKPLAWFRLSDMMIVLI